MNRMSTSNLRAPAKLHKNPSSSTLRPLTHSNNTSTTSTKLSSLSKRASTASIRTLIRKKSTHSIAPDKLSPSPSISAPAPPRKLLRLSELLDPEDLMRAEQRYGTPGQESSDGDAATAPSSSKRLIVHSPSGKQLDVETFARRPDRPLTVGERQERIRAETARLSEQARRERLAEATRKKERCCAGVCVVM